MKKVLKLLSIMVLILYIVGCNSAENVPDSGTSPVIEESTTVKDTFTYNSDIRYAERFEMITLSEAGVIVDDRDEGFIHLVTIDEGEDMLLCYDPNCTHPKTEATGDDPKCMAALYKGICRAVYYNGTIYFFVADGIYEHKIYTMETNGSGRRLFAELPFFYNASYVTIFKDDKMYYAARIPHKIGNTTKVGYTERIIEMSLRDGSYRFVTEENNGGVDQASLVGDTLFMRVMYNGEGACLKTVNINTLEERTIITKEEWAEGYRYIDAYDEDSYVFYDKSTSVHKIGIKNVDGTLEKILLEGGENEKFGNVASVSCGMLFYQRKYDYNGEAAGYYFMSVETGETVNITEEAEKYGIVAYDGYYDAFISRTYDEKAMDMIWGMWSREKILSEAAN